MGLPGPVARESWAITAVRTTILPVAVPVHGSDQGFRQNFILHDGPIRCVAFERLQTRGLLREGFGALLLSLSPSYEQVEDRALRRVARFSEGNRDGQAYPRERVGPPPLSHSRVCESRQGVVPSRRGIPGLRRHSLLQGRL